MVRLTILRTYVCPEGMVTGNACRSIDIDSPELEKLLVPEHDYVGIRLVGHEILPVGKQSSES